MRHPANNYQGYAATKIKDLDSLLEVLQKERRAGKTIATLNGSFDLFHAGHLHIIYEASKMGDILVLALNTDASIKRYKSPNRPIIPLPYRMQTIAALSFVDFVISFDEDDPRELLKKIRPDVHVNGEEYGKECIEAETLREINATLHLVNRIPGLATSDIIHTIKNLCD